MRPLTPTAAQAAFIAHERLQRAFLAQRLHDGLCQQLTALSLLAHASGATSQDSGAVLSSALRETRDLMRSLRGLGDELAATGEDGVRVVARLEGTLGGLPAPLREGVRAVAEIAVWQAVARRGARSVVCRFGGALELLTCHDDGDGFPDFPDLGLQLAQSHATLLGADLTWGRPADGQNALRLIVATAESRVARDP